MKYIMAITISLILIGLISFPAYTQPRTPKQEILPKQEIPADVAYDVKQQIERLYSSDAVERGLAAHRLGEMGAKAAPAVPFLIEILSDKTKLFNRFTARETSPRHEAIEALEMISGFIDGRLGEDPVRWRKWWRNNKDTLLRIRD